MRKALPWLLAVAALSQVEISHAQVAKLDVYADMAQSACSLNDQGLYPPVLFVYYFFNGPETAGLVRFRATKPACWTNATFAGDTTPFVSIGNSQVDWSVAFGACLQPPVYVGKTAYVIAGGGGQAICCNLIAQAPLGGFPFVLNDCSFVDRPLVSGSSVTINPDASCPCGVPVATEPSSWGRVKALYR